MMHIKTDDLTGAAIRILLEAHFADMLANSPMDQCHFLDFDGLNGDDVTFWSIWDCASLAGCGALRQLSPEHGEIKSMRTHADHLRKGVGARMLELIITEAESRGIKRLSLETGSGVTFDAAHALYRRFGFDYCPAFGDYRDNEFSQYMTRAL